jgi:hypothetical protein
LTEPKSPATDARQSLHLRYEGLCFRVVSPESSHLRWLENFFSPHFSIGGSHVEPVEIELLIDADLYRQCQESRSVPSVIHGFALDSSVVQLSLLGEHDGDSLLFDDHYRIFYRVAPDRRRVTIVAGRNVVSMRPALMRVIREYAMNHSQQNGGFFLHASCFLSEGRPVIVTGPKRSGKTTLLAFACGKGSAEYLSNDRILVRKEDRRYVLRSMPSIVSLREKTLWFFPAIEKCIRDEGLHFDRNPDEHRKGVDPLRRCKGNRRCLVTPPQFCETLSARQVTGASDPVIVFPVITNLEGTFSLTTVNDEEKGEYLSESLFGAKHWVTSTPVFNLGKNSSDSDPEKIEEKCRRFAAGHRCLRLEIGRNLYDRDENAKRLIAALLGDSPRSSS